MNGHHLIEFTSSIDTNLNTSKLKIRLATLWIKVEPLPSNTKSESSKDDVHTINRDHRLNVDKPIAEIFRNMQRKIRKRRKRKSVKVSDILARSSENHSYNHITMKPTDDDYHIIKSNEKRMRRKITKSINKENSNKFSSLSSYKNREYLQDQNLTLWIFRISNISNSSMDNVDDEVSMIKSYCDIFKNISFFRTLVQFLNL